MSLDIFRVRGSGELMCEIGTIPMGLATIINMIVFVCVPAWGTWAANMAWGFWWADVVLALASCLLLPWIVIYKHPVSSPSSYNARKLM